MPRMDTPTAFLSVATAAEAASLAWAASPVLRERFRGDRDAFLAAAMQAAVRSVDQPALMADLLHLQP
jgi:hypothetical protein